MSHNLMLFALMDGDAALHCVEPGCETWISGVNDKTVDELASIQAHHRIEKNADR